MACSQVGSGEETSAYQIHICSSTANRARARLAVELQRCYLVV